MTRAKQARAGFVALAIVIVAIAAAVVLAPWNALLAKGSAASGIADSGYAPTPPPHFDVPDYSGSPAAAINGNEPFFTAEDYARGPFEAYSKLDALGRCGTAFALVGKETMPTEPRGSIGMVRPSGWQVAKYGFIDGGYLYNRCHLIAFSLAGENDNELNLITGTRSLNTQGMLPYEEKVASYIDSTRNHVLYRVTPMFDGSNLVASGVLMEARSIEDDGKGISFCVWCYNVEPGVIIDYSNGNNREGTIGGKTMGPGAQANTGADSAETPNPEATPEGSDGQAVSQHYVLNTNTHRFHKPDCPSVAQMKEKNKSDFEGTRDEAIARGYTPCGSCNP